MSHDQRPSRLESVRDETWQQRVERRFAIIAATKPIDERFTTEQNRSIWVDNAQFQADKEMLDEIHLMLRFLVDRLCLGPVQVNSERRSNADGDLSGG